ncbi:unnamed protein product, partial [Rotaria sp. Silwood1]
MDDMIRRIKTKLPNSVLTINADYDCDQENEREIEEMQHVEVSFSTKKSSSPEATWDFNKVFKRNFQEKALKGKTGYPKLQGLGKCFEFTDIDDLKNLKWH